MRRTDNRLVAYYQDKLQNLAKYIRLQFDSNLEVETICVPGPFPNPLNDLVCSKQVDLVVMGTKGAHNWLDKIFGTNTASFIKQAACPVLAIPSGVQLKFIKTIAYASNFESQETMYLKQLVKFAEPLGSSIAIFNIKSENQLDLVSDQQILRKIKRDFPENNFSFSQIKENDIIAGIETFVRENQIDILALSVYEPDMLERIFHNSVSEQLVYRSQIPLLALSSKPYSVKKTTNSKQQKSQEAH
ncbi:universal stress protein [Adhaeribacter rhizoryzae]|uniref:Universal stress protein n=1 Tax=Adhaeribacter rhizoryzae TaxID=2607907 RepID=A0A5M6CXI7_9BACT|nr:universal stress protein [Adhaeribacter rhizoryzae]